MKIGSLFSGIGGIELGLFWAGVGHVAWHVEQDPFCRAVLEKHWPGVKSFDDVCAVGRHNLTPVDVICGGFPCQDLSMAGRGAGLEGERSKLWFEYARIVEEMKPRFVVIENVSALLHRGFERVLEPLNKSGYDAEWSTLRASDVGQILGKDEFNARHRRERLFVIAWLRDPTKAGTVGKRLMPDKPTLARASQGLPPRIDVARPGEKQKPWEAPRVVTEEQDRTKRIKALGNAVVPHAAMVVGKRLLQIKSALDKGEEP